MKSILASLACYALCFAQEEEGINLKKARKNQSHYGLVVGFTSMTIAGGDLGYMTAQNPSIGSFVEIRNNRFARSDTIGLYYKLRASFDNWDEITMPGFTNRERDPK